jgi:hypothetical protein
LLKLCCCLQLFQNFKPGSEADHLKF